MNPKAKELDLQLSKLHLADGASFDSARSQHEPHCMADTRVDLLRELQEWASCPRNPILWLSGMAGTGKSTIARTMADSLSTQKKLAGNFFFCRGAGDMGRASTFVTTLARQLASIPWPEASPSFKELVCDAILHHGNVLAQGLRNQWKELIIGPLSRIKPAHRITLIFVIDALDECDSEDDIRLILQLFIEVTKISNIDLGILITSRPETTLLQGFQDIPEIIHRRLDLREIPRQTVEHDIYVFIKEKLGRIKSKSKSQDWLSEADLVSLVQKADCLFIYAATVCRFIGGMYDVPEDCVSNILQGRSTRGGDTAAIDAIYTQVLSSALARPGESQEMTQWLVDRFREVVGSIIVLLDTLSVAALGGLLSMRVEKVEVTLGRLGSVLDIPGDTTKPIRLLHPSFRDFLLNEARCGGGDFHVQAETAHSHLAIRCLDILCQGLQKNICNLKALDSNPQEVSEDTLNRHLPKHLQYACQYWTAHLSLACPVDASQQRRNQLGLCDDGKVHTFFKGKFLYWLESMSIMCKLPETVLMLQRLSSMLKVSRGAETCQKISC